VLTRDEIDIYRDRGYLLLPDRFDATEIDLLLAETARLSRVDRPQRIMENDGSCVRSVYAVHRHSDAFDRFTRDARTLEPARQLLGGDVYIHQTQLNPKAPIAGDVWEWHQDYLYWARDDGMPSPRALNVAVFLDEVTEFNGPVFVMPGSHQLDLDPDTTTDRDGWQHTLTADFRHKITPVALRRMADRFGLESVKGKPGTVCVFHSQLLHCSPPNLSGNPRTVLFIRYNSVTNRLRPVANPRPDWLAARDPSPLAVLPRPFAAAEA
jgi:ectoine hydroxylase